MIQWKDSCKFDHLHGAMVLAVMRAEKIFEQEGAGVVITSGNDSAHMVGSKHYDGRGLDFRVHHLEDEPARVRVARALKTALGPQFTVIYEGAGTPNAHLHVQFNGQ